MKKRLKIIVGAVLGLAVALGSLYFFWLTPRYTVPILIYHEVSHKKSLLSVTPENFEQQMRYLKAKGYRVISLGELAESIKERKKPFARSIVITFDDGFKSAFTDAYPVLKKYGFPATVFLISNKIGTDARYLNWDQIREMSAHNISFGGHTANHVYLPSAANSGSAWEEVAGCKKSIEAHIGLPVDYFCYPFGGVNPRIEELVRRAGYKGACTIHCGFDKFNKTNLYELNRISIRNGDPYFSAFNLSAPLWFRAKVSGYYDIFRKVGKKN
ncbi:MAG TPA: polysaccharide deacetylase family protein [Patescibacteria group bacterium]|nr:polysaccharide deacetylase family protein [Patescibacteria group bacterium]